MNLAIVGAGKAKVEVSEVTFGREFNEALVHQVVTAYMAGGRQGSSGTEDSFGSKRWWPQAVAAKGHGSRSFRYYPQPNLAQWWSYFCC